MGEEQRNERLAKNERLIRAANEEVEHQAEDWTSDAPAPDVVGYEAEFFCACGRDDCDETILLTIGEYQDVHSHPHRFVVAPGHENPEIERTVERHESYDVVEKLPQYQA